MTEPLERCSFEFDPEVWKWEKDGRCFVDPYSDEEILTENADGDTVWRCPHEAADGEAECVFHLPRDSAAKPDAKTVADAFLDIANGEREALDGDGPRPARFLGAAFESLDLDTARIGDGRPIDLRHAEVERAQWEVETVESALVASGLSVRSSWDCDGVTFGGGATFNGAEFGGMAEFNRAEFSGIVGFRNAEFGSSAGFGGAEFGSTVYFTGAEFSDGVGFNETEFGGDAVFNDGEFGGIVWFRGAKFGGDADFRGAEFEEIATFGIDERPPTSQFQSSVNFRYVTADRLEFVDEYDSPPGGAYTFLGEVDFEGADIPEAIFIGVSFREAPMFEDANLTRADLSNSSFEGATFEGANLTRADLSESDFSSAVFNDAFLSQASLYGRISPTLGSTAHGWTAPTSATTRISA